MSWYTGCVQWNYLLLLAATKSWEEVFSNGVLLERLCVPLRGGNETATAAA